MRPEPDSSPICDQDAALRPVGTRRRPRPDLGKINAAASYQIKELASLLNVGTNTLRRWIARGLPAIMDKRPFLVLGRDVIAFARRRRRKKQPCGLDELFCLRCKAPRRAAFACAEFTPLTPNNGNLMALCCECATVMYKRVSIANMPAVQGLLQVTIKHAPSRLGNRDGSSSNDVIGREAV